MWPKYIMVKCTGRLKFSQILLLAYTCHGEGPSAKKIEHQTETSTIMTGVWRAIAEFAR
jgi:hypothetical protein